MSGIFCHSAINSWEVVIYLDKSYNECAGPSVDKLLLGLLTEMTIL